MTTPKISLTCRNRGYLVACHTCWWHHTAPTEHAAEQLIEPSRG